MDYRRALATFIIGLSTLAVDKINDPPIREARWIASDQRLTLLTMPPISCVRPSRDPLERESRAVGETAFATPLLLGGQAARAGLSCASCHINGRSNPGFFFPGVSGAPGTADVTSSILSSHRGDSRFNPKRIPDLAVDKPKISRAVGDPALPAFINGLITGEFDGPEPTPVVLNGLADFVRSLSSEACGPQGNFPVTFTSDFRALPPALRAANDAMKRGDHATAGMMIAGARATLGRLYERYQGKVLAPERATILRLDDQLQALQQSDAKALPENLARDVTDLQTRLSKREAASLYNPKLLAKALK